MDKKPGPMFSSATKRPPGRTTIVRLVVLEPLWSSRVWEPGVMPLSLTGAMPRGLPSRMTRAPAGAVTLITPGLSLSGRFVAGLGAAGDATGDVSIGTVSTLGVLPGNHDFGPVIIV